MSEISSNSSSRSGRNSGSSGVASKVAGEKKSAKLTEYEQILLNMLTSTDENDKGIHSIYR